MNVPKPLPTLMMHLRRCTAAAGLAVGAAAFSVAACAAEADSPEFQQNCVACHGVDAKGVEGLGVNLIESPFVGRTSGKDLVAFIRQGRLPDDPNSRTGRPMPGFSWIPEADLQAIAAFVKSRNTIK